MDKSQGLTGNQWLGKLEQTYQVLVKLVGGLKLLKPTLIVRIRKQSKTWPTCIHTYNCIYIYIPWRPIFKPKPFDSSLFFQSWICLSHCQMSAFSFWSLRQRLSWNSFTALARGRGVHVVKKPSGCYPTTGAKEQTAPSAQRIQSIQVGINVQKVHTYMQTTINFSMAFQA